MRLFIFVYFYFHFNRKKFIDQFLIKVSFKYHLSIHLSIFEKMLRKGKLHCLKYFTDYIKKIV